jgi:two-component SAPR family response regulator
MNKKGPIVLIENNQGDRKLFTQIFSELGVSNRILCFNSGNDAYNYLTTHNISAFLIFADIVLLHMDDKQVAHIPYKNLSIELNCPCLFFTTVFNQCFVVDVYSIPTQSYVVKPYTYEKFKQVIQAIVEYWKKIHSVTQHGESKMGNNQFKN